MSSTGSGNASPWSLVQQQGGQLVTQAVRNVAPQRTFIRKEDLAKPETMARVLNNFLKEVETMTAAARSLPFLSGVWFKGVQFVANTAQSISHQLGRPYQGYWVSRIQNVSLPVTFGFPLYEVPLLAGQSATQTVNLETPVTATYDFVVF
jgi:hypothetical protein